MPYMGALFSQTEIYDKIDIAYLSFSKTAKVIRHLTAFSDDKVFRKQSQVACRVVVANASRVEESNGAASS
ncbi:hypothetical protein GYMLUDRAFT_47931 [Collybiopsis luxurians FD-317 M1]|uniref:Uncharacterized protein n=1 Tax=Collybiopsis luxurians FD-317 M1 TaxID=944289 RepID=A0A0D0CBF7_9AGAR|nr:hypothetical protein GYMLUDRAFT_47931 [Collybiopsis luxurians FD-317 M1]